MAIDIKNTIQANATSLAAQKLFPLSGKKDNLVVKNEEMEKIIALTKWLSLVEKPVIIQGESGVGKKTIAILMHSFNAKRKKYPMIKVNCSAIPRKLQEREFFGYEPGAFKGANRSGKPGYFELANKGTILLDNISALPRELQLKLLRVLHDQEVTRLGGTKPIKLDVRVLITTNKDLVSMIKENYFLKDLYYGTNIIPIRVPSLRERKNEIVPFIYHYLNIYNKKYDFKKSISCEAINCLKNYDWPGNISELADLIEWLIVTTDSPNITLQHLPHKCRIGASDQMNLKAALEEVERHLVKKALKLHGTTYKAAEALGVSQSTVVRMAKKYDLQISRSRKG